MNGLIQDLRYALRQSHRSPGFALVAISTLALGIGANTGIFTLVNAVLLKSLPVPNPEQLFLVRQRDRFAEQTRVSYPLYRRMLKAMPASAHLAAMARPSDFYLKIGSGQPEMTKGQLVSGNYFQTFETYPLLGRLLTPEDNRIVDGHPVAVISYGCWKRRFSLDRSVIGRELTINGIRFTIVGVTAPDFFGAEPGRVPDFWLPIMMQSSLHFAQHYSKSTTADADKPWVLQEDITWLSLIVRASNRAVLPQISGVLNQLFSRNLERNRIRTNPPQEQARLENQLELEPGSQGTKSLQREFSQPLLVLAGMVGLVLLIACDIYVPGNGELAATPQTNIVSLHYFENVGMPLLHGRDFTQADDEKAPHIAIINQSLAHKLFAGEDPIGRRFGYDSASANEFQIIGVVADAQVNSVREPAPAMIYFPLLQAVTNVESLDIRAAGDPGSLTEPVRQALTSVDPDLPVGEITTMADQVSSNLAQQRLIARLTAMFGTLAVGLACLGLYGVMSYTIARRTSELGIRLALGASRNSVLWLVLRRILVLIGTGMAAGLLLSFFAGRTVTSLLFGLSPYDPANMLGAAIVVLLVSVAAGLKPAWRAAHVNPTDALSVE